MELSLFLAKALGLYLIIVCCAVLVNRKVLAEMVSEVAESPALVFLAGAITLAMGLLLVLSHNIWVKNWTVLITVLAWLFLIGGMFRLFFPKVVMSMARNINLKAYSVLWILFIFLGAFLAYKGFG